jgi:hypothetical protein
LLYVQSCTPDDGRKDRPKHVQCYAEINKFEKLVHLVGFTIGIYYDAGTYERQKMTNKIHFKVNGVVCSLNCLQLVSAAVAAIVREILLLLLKEYEGTNVVSCTFVFL